MKKFIKRKFRSILYFVELFFKIRVGRKSPVDIYYDHLSQDCYTFFEREMKQSKIFLNPADVRKFSIFSALNNSQSKDLLYLEFGVFKAESINFFGNFLSKYNLKIYGFDSFRGLDEDYFLNDYKPKGTFNLKGKIPKVLKNVEIIPGKVQSTLDEFLKNKNKKKIIFAHFDMDLYEPTKFALQKIKPFLQKGSIILFDQFYGFPNWQEHEYKALIDVIDKKEFKYIAFGEEEVAIEII